MYRALVTGTNYVLKVHGDKQRCGFHAVREVEAETRWEAMHSAVKAVAAEAKDVEALNDSKNPPQVFAVLAHSIDGSDSLLDPESAKRMIDSGAKGGKRKAVLNAEGFKFYKEGFRDRFVHWLYQLTNVPSATHQKG